MRVILGSTSPRRRAILSTLFPALQIMDPDADETWYPGMRPEAFAEKVSIDKCLSVADSIQADEEPLLVVTADTIVTIDDMVIGKPTDFDDAVKILRSLAGRTHRVITAISILPIYGDFNMKAKPLTSHETTSVTFRDLNRGDILRYLSSIEWRDKAGAYAFQESGAFIIDTWEGSATNIIGFPLRLFFSMLVDARLGHLLFAAG